MFWNNHPVIVKYTFSPLLQLFIYCMTFCIVLDTFIYVIIKIRQYKYLEKINETAASEMWNMTTPEIVTASKRQTTNTLRFLMYQKIIKAVIEILKIYFGYYHNLWSSIIPIKSHDKWDGIREFAASVLFVLALNCFGFLEDLPFYCYKSFVIEKRCENWKNAINDLLIHLYQAVYVQIQMLLCVSVIVLIAMTGNHQMYLMLTAFSIVAGGIMYYFRILPVYSAYKEVLPECEMRKKILKLCTELRFPISEIIIAEGVKHDYLKHAECLSVSGPPVLVLYDSLFQNKAPINNNKIRADFYETVAVVWQAIGSWRKKHHIKLCILENAKYIPLFFLYTITYKNLIMAEALGFKNGFCPLIAGFIVLHRHLLAPLNTIIEIWINSFEQYYTRRADLFAFKLRYGFSLPFALLRLGFDFERSPYWNWLDLTSYRHELSFIERNIYLFDPNDKDYKKKIFPVPVVRETHTDNNWRNVQIRFSREFHRF